MADEDKDTEFHPDDEAPPILHDDTDTDEYHFTEEPSMEAFTAATTPSKKPPKKGLFSRRSFLFIIAVVVIGIAVYKFLGTLQAPTTPSPIKPKPFVQPPQITPPVAPAPVGLTPEQMNALQNHLAQTDTQITALGNQVNGLASSVASMQATLTTLSNQLQALGDAFQDQKAELEVLKQKPKPPIKKYHKIHYIPAPKPIYHIEAIIPDRAWLKAPDGTSFTVTKGSALPGYGVVKSIDAVNGLVITSSGAILRYNGN